VIARVLVFVVLGLGAGARTAAQPTCEPGTVCRPEAGPCDVAETCNEAGMCPADAFASIAAVCRPAVDACDLDDLCSGNAAACPAFNRMKTGWAGVTCAFDRSPDPSSCAGDARLRPVGRLFRAAGARVTAASKKPGIARRRICTAARKLARAFDVVTRAVESRHPVPSACAVELKRVVGDAMRRLDGTGVTCGASKPSRFVASARERAR
jgi:hypothetical protein